MDTQIVAYTHGRILLSHKRMKYRHILQQGWTQKHYANLKRSDTKSHIVCDSMYMKYPE